MDIKPTLNNDFSDINQILTSLQNEAHTLFEKLAKVKGETVEETIKNTKTASRNYLQALEIEITFKNDLPTDINKYEEKLTKVASAIEYCWHLLSPESRHFFINLAYGFTKVTISKCTGITGLKTWMKLFLPSIKQGENLFEKYKNAMTLIPIAVDKAVNSTDLETTVKLQTTAELLLKQINEIDAPGSSLEPYMKHFGPTPEEQLEKNQPALKWVKARLEKIEKHLQENQ